MFKIYNASAGSGKTYSLVKDYLSIVLNSKAYLPHRHILAITFTNKAVEEMKHRIVSALMQFSSPDILTNQNDLFDDLVLILRITPEKLHQKSKDLIQKILHNYGSFEVSTIDKFNQKLIRTFAYDLKLPMNFEVELETNLILQKAVDNLISKVGQNPTLTKVLIDYAIMKSDDDKSWDIALDLNKSAQLLTQEPALHFLKTISDKNLQTFEAFKLKLQETYDQLEQQIVQLSTSILVDLESQGITFKDFSRSLVPNYFSALASKNFKVNLTAAWQDKIETSALYPKAIPDSVKSKIDALQPKIAATFLKTKAAIYHLKYLANIRKNITPLSVLTLIQKELDQIKKDQNLLMISEFNALIAKEIKAQPAPFIYERIGEKFDHYFIDEFQDTSVLQWQNLTPLMVNTLSSAAGSVLLVGDAKQAIYRWRGGNPEQFMDLLNHSSSFPVQATVSNLPKNYRSCEQIVAFNNALFQYISNRLFSNELHQKLYQSAAQTPHSDKSGFVQLTFLDFKKGDDKPTLYADQVYHTIQSIKASDSSVSFSDICVLVRKKKDGVAISNYLISKEIKVISNETLLISNSPEVQFLIDVLRYLQTPSDYTSKLNILNYLIPKNNIDAAHQFRLNHLPLPMAEFFAALQPLGIDFKPYNALKQSIYEVVESIIRIFNLVKSSDAYIHFFLDFVFEFSQKEDSSITQFLEHYEQYKDKLSVRSPKQIDAVQISTIHKSKGLEFPIVILPFADLNIYKEIEPKAWMSTAHLDPNIPFVLMNYNKDFEHFGSEGKACFDDHQSKLELDNINLLYVALTRPVEQLYIISDASGGLKHPEDFKTFSDLFIAFLQDSKKWNPEVLRYDFGTIETLETNGKTTYPTVFQNSFISSPISQSNMGLVTRADRLWSEHHKEAIERGNLIHLLLSKINRRSDISTAIDFGIREGLVSSAESNTLTETLDAIVGHPNLKQYFSVNLVSYNEREIITNQGLIVIPDRLVIMPGGSAVIIDYKTGEHQGQHLQQLDTYAAVIEQMGYSVETKLLVYIYPKLEIKEFK